jgi:TonB family protein
MRNNPRFWRNVTLIGVAHTAVISGLIHWTYDSKNAPTRSIVWIGASGTDESGALTATASPATSRTSSRHESDVEPDSHDETTAEVDRPVRTSAKSDIELPAARPSAPPTSTRHPAATPKVKVTPRPKPKPKPRPTATPKPKPSPRKLLQAKASPKPSPERTQDKQEEDRTATEEPAEAPGATATADSQRGTEKERSAGSGSAGHGGGGNDESQFGWYGSMLHDRFYSEWVQPTNVATTGAKNSVLAKLRIETDGRVSSFEIIKPSGNGTMDESVAAAGKRVTQVDPLPPGLGNSDHYDVKINFELNSD